MTREDDEDELPEAEPTYDDVAETCHGKPLRFDPDMVGKTCGGLELRGWLGCDVCGRYYLASGRCKPTSSSDGTWALAKGGRSLTAGALKLRVEGKAPPGEIEALMARVVRVPELEAEIAQLRAQLAGCDHATPPHRRTTP